MAQQALLQRCDNPAAVLACAAGGITGLLMLTALVMGYMYPAKVMSFTSIGYQMLQVRGDCISQIKAAGGQ